ncbi:PTS glucitol/sorbitol transporter subunit IIC [Brachybacterium sp. AOP43-C2-M15]|uniref:PTS glucitol/sorbitol transporter subunit IIC n=1 Tax=Brachybacterium sp. AOP43-C2-M15 TaxID=3457661 RepID=UPI004033C989
MTVHALSGLGSQATGGGVLLADPAPAVGADNPVMQAITWAAEHFIGLFQAAAESFTGLFTGILPLLIVLLTAMYAITTWIGEERVTRAVRWSGRFALTRYTLMPILAMIMLTNPMAYTFGRFLPERHKPAFYDSAVSFCHPVTSFFPHANAGEIFVWTGVSAGVLAINPDAYAKLAVMYFLVGIVVILIRGIVTQWITGVMINRSPDREKFAQFDEDYAAGHFQGAGR